MLNKLAPSLPQDDWSFSGLVSLWDIMKKFDPKTLVRLERLQNLVGQVLQQKVALDSQPRNAMLEMAGSHPSDDFLGPLVQSVVYELKAVAKDLDLVQSLKNFHGLDVQPPQTQREVVIYYQILMNELEGRLFLFVPAERAEYWDSRSLVSDTVKAQFPESNVVPELRAAGSAHACALYTASVFHSMRAAEKGLLLIAEKLNVPVTGDEMLKNVIDGIESAAKKLDDVKKHPDKKSDSQFFCGVATEGGIMKDAWRNHVAHAKSVYMEGDALEVLKATCRFFEKVAGRFDEHGVPVAKR